MTAPVARTVILFAALAGTALRADAASAGGCASIDCYRRIATPPLYDTVSEQRIVSPPRTVYRTTPPVYDTVTERVMVSPGGRRWETRYDAHGHLVGCWVSTPPQYAVRARRVLVRQAEVIPETLPPVYASYQRPVLVQPAGAAWVPVGGPVVGSIPDAMGITGASSADVGVGLGFSTGSIYDGY